MSVSALLIFPFVSSRPTTAACCLLFHSARSANSDNNAVRCWPAFSPAIAVIYLIFVRLPLRSFALHPFSILFRRHSAARILLTSLITPPNISFFFAVYRSAHEKRIHWWRDSLNQSNWIAYIWFGRAAMKIRPEKDQWRWAMTTYHDIMSIGLFCLGSFPLCREQLAFTSGEIIFPRRKSNSVRAS